MHHETPDSDRLFEEALDLLIRLQDDPANPVARDLVRRWRARGPAHEAAWTEASEIHGMTGVVLQERRQSGRAGKGISRRKVILGGAAGLAAAGAVLYGPELLVRSRADHTTTTAELRRVTLADGTDVTLGPDSAIKVLFQPAARHVELLAGMAFFEVAPDSARPFRAVANDMTATALGTAFDVSRDAGFLNVAVTHGLVAVAIKDRFSLPEARLSQGEWLSFDESSSSVERGQLDTDQVAAWREGMIVAERETIASVVAKIGRWQKGRIMIADPRFGARRVSGVFDLNNPIAALQAVAHPHGGKVRQLSPWLTVISPI